MIALLLVAILVVLLIVDKPEDVGLKPYGDRGDTPAHIAPPAAFSRAFEILFESMRSPAFWVLADAEGNEACVTTWQGRD